MALLHDPAPVKQGHSKTRPSRRCVRSRATGLRGVTGELCAITPYPDSAVLTSIWYSKPLSLIYLVVLCQRCDSIELNRRRMVPACAANPKI